MGRCNAGSITWFKESKYSSLEIDFEATQNKLQEF